MNKVNWGVLGTAGIAKGQTIPGMTEAENCYLYAISGRDMKKVYTHGTAAVLRMKDEVLKDVSLLRENCDDIAADAKEINEKRQAEYDAQQIEDAKALLAAQEGDAVPEAEG